VRARHDTVTRRSPALCKNCLLWRLKPVDCAICVCRRTSEAAQQNEICPLARTHTQDPPACNARLPFVLGHSHRNDPTDATQLTKHAQQHCTSLPPQGTSIPHQLAPKPSGVDSVRRLYHAACRQNLNGTQMHERRRATCARHTTIRPAATARARGRASIASAAREAHLCSCSHGSARPACAVAAHFLRGGVSGRLPISGIFDLSAGLRMRKEHMRLSSTDMTAPALSNSPQ
jgi:hypothetical protein